MSESATAGGRLVSAFGPFMPGRGVLPPYMAGREREQAKIKQYLDLIEQGMPAPSSPILFGPRGNGKTALLNWTKRQALTQGIKVIEVGITDASSEESLIDRLSPRSWWTGIFESISWRGTEVRLRKSGTSTVTGALTKLARRSPAIVLIDEAHRLDTKQGAQLLDGAQAVAVDDLPLLLILAGTPKLPRHLRKMHATYWERSSILPIQRLEKGASAEAIRIPLEDAGKEITPSALESVVADCHGYPYFLQLWGKAIWDEMHHDSPPIGVDDVDRVRPEFESMRDQFYKGRYRELDNGRLLGPAVALAETYGGTERLDSRRVDKVLESAIEADGRTATPELVRQVREELHDLGYIWSPDIGSNDYYVSGIPSLMSFVFNVANR